MVSKNIPGLYTNIHIIDNIIDNILNNMINNIIANLFTNIININFYGNVRSQAV